MRQAHPRPAPRVPAAAVLLALFSTLSAQDRAPGAGAVEPNGIPALDAPGTFHPQDNTVILGLDGHSAACAGLILANGGRAASEDSFFFRNHGFKVELRMSDSEDLNALNRGDLAGHSSTADVPALYGEKLNAISPVLFGFSRGADQVVLRRHHQTLRDVVGETLVTARHSKSEFFIRYLCLNNDLALNDRVDLSDPPAQDRINLLFTRSAAEAARMLQEDLESGTNQLAGCVGSAPGTRDVVQRSAGKAYVNTTNLNQLLVAHVLLLNKGFAEAHPKMIKGLVHGIIDGNHRLIEVLEKGSDVELELIAEVLSDGLAERADAERIRYRLEDCNLANHALNKAFLTDSMQLGGSYAGIHEEALRCYGNLLKDTAPPDPVSTPRFVLELEEEIPEYAELTANVETRFSGPRSTQQLTVWKDVNFIFERNVFDQLEDHVGENRTYFQTISRFMKYSPGASLRLIGHLDDSEALRKGETWKQTYSAMAVDASIRRALAAKNSLVQRYGLRESQVEVQGKGWDEPKGSVPGENRRVEVQIFTNN